ncbi:MAG TPA: response regulator [Polyangia bacterium]|jgi:CheY-like chemotaxis protein|nr:response regulator [Polyangia bacterium]
MVVESAAKGAVLVVEDDDDQRELLQQLLEEQGYPVFVARNGAEALALLPSVPGLKLVLVDLQMPVMDGRTLIKRLRESAELQHLSIAVCSSDETEPPSGIVEFLQKPTEHRALLELVRQHCD